MLKNCYSFVCLVLEMFAGLKVFRCLQGFSLNPALEKRLGYLRMFAAKIAVPFLMLSVPVLQGFSLNPVLEKCLGYLRMFAAEIVVPFLMLSSSIYD
ncbi:hypothetical protein F2Q69_00035115 [Brassica cretica]|uniref:Uncharacterized protein n=1 Tax=Brassica cretica TaxID=69181 RepID=A0A8S9SW70_BRACR|nr:hypothetical protein F2Q69_00035115 [Brassica cretica]